jgi:GT2 family glycosyltransferase
VEARALADVPVPPPLGSRADVYGHTLCPAVNCKTIVGVRITVEPVVVSLVSFNSQRHMQRCLQAVFSQTYPVKVYLVDNASADGTAAFVAQHYPLVKVIPSTVNLGYTGGHNLVIRETQASYTLILNPDAYLTSTFLEQLVATMETHPEVGIAGGKLYSLRNGPAVDGSQKIIDMTWLDIEKKRRQICYAQFLKDHGQNEAPRFVFAIDGAAMLLRRTMLEDIQIEGEYFDEDFFAGKEDLDISWRAQLCGWKCLYVPSAIAHHLRTFTSKDRRSEILDALKINSVRNRYLVMLKNDLAKHFLRHLPHIASYDLKILAYLLLHERSSLKGYIEALRLAPKALRKRRVIMGRKNVDDAYMLQWFR